MSIDTVFHHNGIERAQALRRDVGGFASGANDPRERNTFGAGLVQEMAASVVSPQKAIFAPMNLQVR